MFSPVYCQFTSDSCSEVNIGGHDGGGGGQLVPGVCLPVMDLNSFLTDT